MRATSETLAPGSSDAAISRSFSSCDHRRRRSSDVITTARKIVIALLLGSPPGPAALASLKQEGLWRRDTMREQRAKHSRGNDVANHGLHAQAVGRVHASSVMAAAAYPRGAWRARYRTG